MISHLTGTITLKTDKFIVIDVNGVGYKAYGTTNLLSATKENDQAKIWTYLAVRENAMDLYGFADKSELDFFELLNTISGVGPKTAIGILNVASVPSLRKAISTGETAHLTKVSGLGKKMADKIVLELKGKLGAYEEVHLGLKEEIDALEALKSLGYSHKESREALQEIDKTITTTSGRVKAALKHLGK
ncbi:MAG: Holliday junction branch migration protein RuvA [bacterium]